MADNASKPTATAPAGAGTKTADAADFTKAAADRMRDAGEQAGTAFQDRVVEPMKRAGETLRESGQKVAENSQTLGLKVLDQAEQNAREAFAAMRKAAQASDLTSVMQVQGDYLREQGSRSMAQAREVAEMIAQFGRDALGSLRGGIDKR